MAVLAAAAQEESHTKSEIMNISIEQRFSRGIFLVPELLGYDTGRGWKSSHQRRRSRNGKTLLLPVP